jgi:hypothetical protein
MTQQQNPDDWVASKTIRELGDIARGAGLTLAQLLDRLT